MARALTGIAGFDQVTGGGLPAERVTLLEGGPGAGKTLLALQFLAHGIQAGGPPGVFVAFEEAPADILANSADFDWPDGGEWQASIAFVDARPNPDLVLSGSFDLDGMLAILGARVAETGAKRIVIDAIDIVLALLPDAAARRRELYRLHHWLREQRLTAIITAKEGAAELDAPGFLQFMVDCAITLRHDLRAGISQRSLQVLKYRGSSFAENQAPLLIGPHGIEVAYADITAPPAEAGQGAIATEERLSTGVLRLDAMLAGGYHRGAGILISGAPGTSKTTLCGAFADACCRRGEATLFVSFDSPAAEVIRNLTSIGLDLAQHVTSGLLRVEGMRSVNGSAELHLLRIKALASEHRARCVIIDPISAFTQHGDIGYSNHAAERLVDWAKASRITLLFSSLMGKASPESESTPLQVSTIADTWIHLSYSIRAGERNRALTIIKSRGTGHSNQVRELLLSDDGITLEDVYLADGEVLMGTLRWARENQESARDAANAAAANLHRLRLQNQAAEMEGQLEALRRQLEMNRLELSAMLETGSAQESQTRREKGELRHRRQADRSVPGTPNE